MERNDEFTEELKNDYTYNTSPNNQNNKQGGYLKRIVVLVASAALFGGVAGGVFKLVVGDDSNRSVESTKTIEKAEDLDNYKDSDEFEGLEETDNDLSEIINEGHVISTAKVEDDGIDNIQSLDVSDIATGVMPAVVSITTKSVEEVNQGFFGGTYQYEAEGSGSGIIIGENDTELLIVTNNHVVAGANNVAVSFIDNEVYEAKVKGVNSDSDLAIIVVELSDLSNNTKSIIKIATLGNSDELKVGEQVVAIGNALGYGQSVTTGIVSAKDRSNDTNVTPLIQTDAAINPGNSGGALLNMKGEVVGINSSKYASTDVEGMGYAISISQVEDILNDLMNRETREKVDEENMGYLGISCGTISQEMSMVYGMPPGVLVSEVQVASGAKRAGIKKNSIITKLDGQTVSSVEELTEILSYYKAGEKIDVTYEYLDDEEYVEKTVTVRLGRKPE